MSIWENSRADIDMTLAENFVHSVSLLSTYSVWDTASGAGVISGNEADEDIFRHGAYVELGEGWRDHNEKNMQISS